VSVIASISITITTIEINGHKFDILFSDFSSKKVDALLDLAAFQKEAFGIYREFLSPDRSTRWVQVLSPLTATKLHRYPGNCTLAGTMKQVQSKTSLADLKAFAST